MSTSSWLTVQAADGPGFHTDHCRLAFRNHYPRAHLLSVDLAAAPDIKFARVSVVFKLNGQCLLFIKQLATLPDLSAPDTLNDLTSATCCSRLDGSDSDQLF